MTNQNKGDDFLKRIEKALRWAEAVREQDARRCQAESVWKFPQTDSAMKILEKMIPEELEKARQEGYSDGHHQGYKEGAMERL